MSNSKTPFITKEEQKAIISKFKKWQSLQNFPANTKADEIFFAYRSMLINSKENEASIERNLSTVKDFLNAEGTRIIELAIINNQKY